jgi:hypothetical protein
MGMFELVNGCQKFKGELILALSFAKERVTFYAPSSNFSKLKFFRISYLTRLFPSLSQKRGNEKVSSPCLYLLNPNLPTSI